jgi:hypothetical protein
MELKDKIIIGLLSIGVLLFGASLFGGSSNIGAYDESYTNFTKLKATDSFISEGTTVLATTTATLKALDGTVGFTGTCAAASTTVVKGGVVTSCP